MRHLYTQYFKVTSILGLSAFYHDSAAALIKDGKIIAAAQEERFTRKKHDASYPFNAVEFVLNEAKLKLSDIDHIAFYEKPFLKFERLLEIGFIILFFRKAFTSLFAAKFDLLSFIKYSLLNKFLVKALFRPKSLFFQHFCMF